MHPTEGFNTEAKPTVWREISVGGGIYALRESRSTPQKSSLVRKHSITLYLSFYRPQRSWAKVIFLHLSVILLTGGCGGLVPGGLQFFGGVLQFFGGVLQFFRGGVSNFWGSSIFRGGGWLQFSGGLQFFLGGVNSNFFSNFFSPKFFWDAPPPPIRSLSGRYASYWNAFLFHFSISSEFYALQFLDWVWVRNTSVMKIGRILVFVVYRYFQ